MNPPPGGGSVDYPEMIVQSGNLARTSVTQQFISLEY